MNILKAVFFLVISFFVTSCVDDSTNESGLVERDSNQINFLDNLFRSNPIDDLDDEIEFCENSLTNCRVILEVTEYKLLDDNKYYDLLKEPLQITISSKTFSNNTSIMQDYYIDSVLEDLYFSLNDVKQNRTIRRDITSNDNIFSYEVYTITNDGKYCSGKLVQDACNNIEVINNIVTRVRTNLPPQIIGKELPDFEDALVLDRGIEIIEIIIPTINKDKPGKYEIEYSVSDEYNHTYSNKMILSLEPFERLFINGSDFLKLSFSNQRVFVYYDGSMESYRFIDNDGKIIFDFRISEVIGISDVKVIVKDENYGIYKIIDFTNIELPQIDTIELNRGSQILPLISFTEYLKFRDGNNMGLINSDGRIIIPPIFDAIGSYFSESTGKYYHYVKLGDLYGIYDSKGDEILPIIYTSINRFESNGESYFELRIEDDFYELYDQDFNIPNDYDSERLINQIKNDQNRIALVDINGNLLTDYIYYRIYRVNDFYILTEPNKSRLEGNKSVRNLYGEVLLEPTYIDDIYIINNYVIYKPVGRNDLIIYDLLNKKEVYSKMDVTFSIRNVDPYGNEKYVVYEEDNNYHSIIFGDDITVVEDAYYISGNFKQSNSITNVAIRDLSGKFIIRGYSFISKGGITTPISVINAEGNFDRLGNDYYTYEGKNYLTLKGIDYGERYGGIVSEDGKFIIPFIYDEIVVDLINGLITARKDNNWFIYDILGNLLTENLSEVKHISGSIYKVNQYIVQFPNK